MRILEAKYLHMRVVISHVGGLGGGGGSGLQCQRGMRGFKITSSEMCVSTLVLRNRTTQPQTSPPAPAPTPASYAGGDVLGLARSGVKEIVTGIKFEANYKAAVLYLPQNVS